MEEKHSDDDLPAPSPHMYVQGNKTKTILWSGKNYFLTGNLISRISFGFKDLYKLYKMISYLGLILVLKQLIYKEQQVTWKDFKKSNPTSNAKTEIPS